jgi:predicted metal-binding membrane protein
VIASCVVVLTALAWAYLIHLDRQMSAAMKYDRMMADMGMATDTPWQPADLFFAFAMWAVMMAGMMTPSASPVLLLFAAMHRGRGGHRATGVVFAFSAGYLAVWAAFSAGAALAQWALHEAAMLSPAMTMSSARLSGGVLIAAGLYQLTPLKGTCLTHCRTPLGFLMSHWRDGTAGAWRMGMAHGTYCVGCCWMVMCVLFAVGVMNLAWVAAITIFVLVEKIGPRGALVARVAGAAMIAGGAWVWSGTV